MVASIGSRRGGGAGINGVAAVGIVLSVAAAVVAAAAAAPTCGDAVSALVPCGPFLVGGGGARRPSERCCSSARALRGMADTAEARRALCRCLEQSGPSFGVLPDRARRLPALCKLGLSIPVGAHTDCSKIT
ncbi:non-specific lipid-transfer protein 1-like [Oryza brachyantha]|uniref:non-specific lipid-transfer protein 1-like n=1 Tax=Oryza brachyantha TaxID=4533 RepID=UPI001ADD426F|nr:non-specific lipid-transfer protein 1-like [Oryza brachyantha]